MRHLAASDAARPIGCTQTTEILNTPGLALIGPLPAGCELATMYAAAPTAQTTHAVAAAALINLLAAPGAASARGARRLSEQIRESVLRSEPAGGQLAEANPFAVAEPCCLVTTVANGITLRPRILGIALFLPP